MADATVKLDFTVNLGEARLLTQSEQERYEEACKDYGEKARNNLKIGLKGSNLFRVLLLNQIGIKTASLFELDLIAKTQPSFLSGTYEDAPAVALRSVQDSYSPNNSILEKLVSLIKTKKFPHTIIIEGLELEEDNNSNYGLNLKKGREFRVIEAPDFDCKNNGRNFVGINSDYTIEFDDKGARTFYARDKGLSRLYLDRNLNLDSSNENLAYSYGNGRVVVVNGEAISQKFLEEKVAKLQNLRETEIAEVQRRYIQAERVLRGEK